MYRGVDILLYILEEDQSGSSLFRPLVCLTSHRFSESTETLETTTRSNNGWRSFIGGNQTSSLSFSGIVDKDISSDRIGYFELKERKRDRSVREFKIQSIDGVYVETIQGIITDLSDNAESGNLFTFDCTVIGVREPITTISPIPDIEPDPIDDVQGSFQYEFPVNF